MDPQPALLSALICIIFAFAAAQSPSSSPTTTPAPPTTTTPPPTIRNSSSNVPYPLQLRTPTQTLDQILNKLVQLKELKEIRFKVEKHFQRPYLRTDLPPETTFFAGDQNREHRTNTDTTRTKTKGILQISEKSVRWRCKGTKTTTCKPLVPRRKSNRIRIANNRRRKEKGVAARVTDFSPKWHLILCIQRRLGDGKTRR